ncbi:MAG: hypothetical protein IJ363_12935, partial [Clostridia bacterium]|nr:hypothetical protein [Clostridia bacterium]
SFREQTHRQTQSLNPSKQNRTVPMGTVRFLWGKLQFIGGVPREPSPAGKGDRKAVDEESELRFGIGYNFSWRIKDFTYTPV